MALEIKPRPGGERDACVVCRGPLGAEERWRCDGCQVVLHRDCQATLGGCPTLGCSGIGRNVRAPATPGKQVDEPPRARPLVGVGVIGVGLVLAAAALGLWTWTARPLPTRVPGARPTQLERPDLSHVVPGQRWVFEQRDAQGQLVERQEREVLAITPWAVRLRVTRSGPDGAPGREPARWEQSWEVPGVARSPGHDHRDCLRHETLTLAGIEWNCAVRTLAGCTTWTPLSDDTETFPGSLRLEGGFVGGRLELVEVLPPPAR